MTDKKYEDTHVTFEEVDTSGINGIKEGIKQLKKERERYLEERELEKEGNKIRKESGFEQRERGIRETSGENGTVERTVTGNDSITREGTTSFTKGETIIFGKKYIKGEKSSRIRLILFLILLAVIIAFFVFFGILGSQQGNPDSFTYSFSF